MFVPSSPLAPKERFKAKLRLSRMGKMSVWVLWEVRLGA